MRDTKAQKEGGKLNETLNSEIPPVHFLYSSPKIWQSDNTFSGYSVGRCFFEESDSSVQKTYGY